MSAARSEQGARRSLSSTRDVFENAESRLRYTAYSRLQAGAAVFGENLPIPEIVAIGGQSDGKSSLLEAFLGFRFNVREVEMGTRRPLIVQMVHDATANEPRCRLQDEDSEEYGPVIMPETAVAQAIMQRTEEHLKKLGGATVSAKPIVMRAEYKYCPNLTIVDTPGFILKGRAGEADTTPEDIMQMVKAQAAPPHRLILFLQQSSVEWASALWLHVVQAVDPNFQRTIIVASKFDNRLGEFKERWEVDKYLSASGYLPPAVKPFFVALPKDRTITNSAEWRKQLGEVDAGVFKHLRENVQGGFDEDRYAVRVGFSNLRRFLEDELARRYRDAAPATLGVLQMKCDAVQAELRAAETKLSEAEDVVSLRRAGMTHVAGVAEYVLELLDGGSGPDPSKHGMTSEEERLASRHHKWPGVASLEQPPNSTTLLYGGSAFERCLDELQGAAAALSFPAVAQGNLANILLAYKGNNNITGPANAAQDIARRTASQLLKPLLETACSRLAFVIRRVFDIAADRSTREGASKDSLQPYVAFHAALHTAQVVFLNQLEARAKAMLDGHLEVATSKFAVNMLMSSRDFWEEVDEQPQGLPGIHEARMTVPETPPPDMQQDFNGPTVAASRAANGAAPGRHVDDSPSKPRASKSHRTLGMFSGLSLQDACGSHKDVVRTAERLFLRIRDSVIQQQAPATLKMCFLEPIKQRLALDLNLELFGKDDSDFLQMFTAATALNQLKSKQDALQKRLAYLTKFKDEFRELAHCV